MRWRCFGNRQLGDPWNSPAARLRDPSDCTNVQSLMRRSFKIAKVNSWLWGSRSNWSRSFAHRWLCRRNYSATRRTPTFDCDKTRSHWIIRIHSCTDRLEPSATHEAISLFGTWYFQSQLSQVLYLTYTTATVTPSLQYTHIEIMKASFCWHWLFCCGYIFINTFLLLYVYCFYLNVPCQVVG